MKSTFPTCYNYTAHLHKSVTAAPEIYPCCQSFLLSFHKVTYLDSPSNIYYLYKIFWKCQPIICRNGTINHIFQMGNIKHIGIRNITYLNSCCHHERRWQIIYSLFSEENERCKWYHRSGISLLTIYIQHILTGLQISNVLWTR